METAALQRFNEGAAAVIRAALLASDNIQQGPDEVRSGTWNGSRAKSSAENQTPVPQTRSPSTISPRASQKVKTCHVACSTLRSTTPRIESC